MIELLNVTPVIMTKAQAKALLDSLNDTDYVLMGVLNYKKNCTSGPFKRINIKKSKNLVNKAHTVIFMGDSRKIFSYLDLHNTFQDIRSIQPQGVIKTIMLPGL